MDVSSGIPSFVRRKTRSPTNIAVAFLHRKTLPATLLVLSMTFNFILHCIKINDMNVSSEDQHVGLKAKYPNPPGHKILRD